MAEIMQCPACLMWLNTELKEARVINSHLPLYKCEKCGAYFNEDGVWAYGDGDKEIKVTINERM